MECNSVSLQIQSKTDPSGSVFMCMDDKTDLQDSKSRFQRLYLKAAFFTLIGNNAELQRIA